jgi:hypothetical protein
MSYKRIEKMEGGEILGWWEAPDGSIITITKGVAHVVYRRQTVAFLIPEEIYGERPEMAAKKIAARLTPTASDVEE